MTKGRWLAASLLLGVMLILSLWRPWQGAEQEPGEARWLRVEPQLLERRLGLLGRIQPAQQVTLAAPFEGVVQTLDVREGQRVAKGQTLLTLDTTLLDIQLRQAEAELLKAGRALRELRGWESGPQVSRAQRALSVSRRTLASSQTALEDTRRLFERGIVARQELDSLAEQVSAQQLDLRAAEEELQQTRARGQGEYLRIAAMELSNAKAQHEALLAVRARKVITAPFAGLVRQPAVDGERHQRALQSGQLVSQGMPLLGLLELDRLQVLAAVEQADLGKLREGMAVEVSGEGFAGHVLAGRVESVGVQAREDEGQGAWFDLLVALDPQSMPQESGVRLGMSAQVTVLLYRNERGVALPERAVRSSATGGRYVLFREHDGQAPSEVSVTLGEAVVQGVEVKGLRAGYVLIP